MKRIHSVILCEKKGLNSHYEVITFHQLIDQLTVRS